MKIKIVKYPASVEIKDGNNFEINFWDDGEIVISGVGFDDVSFSGIPLDLMKKIQQVIIEYKESY